MTRLSDGDGSQSWHALAIVAGLLLASLPTTTMGQERQAEKDPQIGQEFRVPYQRTLTNHYLVRVRINGSGPFNFLVDTGAPALFIGTEAAKEAGLKPPAADARTIWTDIEAFEIEGGVTLKHMKGSVRDVFQLKGMNALGLPGARIDGILGYTILARFRMEFDPRSDRMTWTRLDFEPKEPYVPENPKDRQAPAEVQAMELIGPMMQFAAIFIGKQQPDSLHPQGLIGIEIAETGNDVRIERVLPGTPADGAGLRVGDLIVLIHDQSIAKGDAAHAAIAKIRPGDEVQITVRRGQEEICVRMTASEGL